MWAKSHISGTRRPVQCYKIVVKTGMFDFLQDSCNNLETMSTLERQSKRGRGRKFGSSMISQLIRWTGLTDEAFASRTGEAPRTVAEWRRGPHAPPMEKYQRILTHFPQFQPQPPQGEPAAQA